MSTSSKSEATSRWVSYVKTTPRVIYGKTPVKVELPPPKNSPPTAFYTPAPSQSKNRKLIEIIEAPIEWQIFSFIGSKLRGTQEARLKGSSFQSQKRLQLRQLLLSPRKRITKSIQSQELGEYMQGLTGLGGKVWNQESGISSCRSSRKGGRTTRVRPPWSSQQIAGSHIDLGVVENLSQA